MPRNSRHKWHRQHSKRKGSVDYYSTDSENDDSAAGCGPSKGSNNIKSKLKSPKQEGRNNEGEKKNCGPVSVSDERWDAGVAGAGGGGGENALSLLAYLEKDSTKADSDSSCREENQKSRRHKSKLVGASNGFVESRVSTRRKETLEGKGKDEGERGKSRVKLEGDAGRKELAEPKKQNSLIANVLTAGHSLRPLEAISGKEVSPASAQISNANEESSQKKVIKSTEWKLQEELRNPELEKELENRILRRREESGDRDRWRDGDRDRDGKPYSSRDSHHRDDRYKAGKHKDDRSRGDRHKDERQADDKSKTKRYKEEWHRDDIHRTDRYKDDKQRDEKPREDRRKDARQKDDSHREAEHRDDKHKDDKTKADKNKEDKLEDKYRDEKYIEDRYKDEKHRGDSYRDDKSKGEKYREEKLHRERTVDRCDSKNSKDESRLQGHLKQFKTYDSDQENSSYYDDRYPDRNNSHDKDRLSQKPEVSSIRKSHEFKDSPSEDEFREASRVCEDEISIQESLPADTQVSSVVDVAAINKHQKRECDSGPNIGREQKRLKATEGGSDLKDALLEERPSLGRESNNSEKLDQRRDRSKGRAVLSTRATTKRHLDSQRGESPTGSCNSSLKSSECLSPSQMRDWSPSPSIRDKDRHSSYDKMIKRKRLDSDRGFNSSIGKREEMDRMGNLERCKPHSGREDELRYRNAGVDFKDSYAHRGRSRSTDRVCNSQVENSKTDRFSRAPSIHGGNSRVGGPEEDASGVDHRSKRPFTVAGDGPKASRHSDEVTSYKSGWSSHNVQNSRSEGFPAQQRTPHFPIRPPGHLPPPPPFRPGIDNPSVLSRSNSGFEEGPCSRDQARADWIANAPFNRGEVNGAVRNWNPQAQGPRSSNFFIPFQHQGGGHPPGTFHTMGQQHAGPPMFRGLRPPTDINHSGVPYHVWDNGDRSIAHNGAFGWQRQIEDVCGPPVQGSFNAWDGYNEESPMYGRRDWYPFGQGMGNRGWDRSTGTGKGHRNDMNIDIPHNESDYHGRYVTEDSLGGTQDTQENHKKIRRERSPESIQIKRSNEVSPKVISEVPPCLSSEVKRTNKYDRGETKYYLSKLNISEELAGPELYNQCINILDRGQNVDTSKANFCPDMSFEGHELEVDTDAETLIYGFDPRQAFFHALSENHMQRAMELYKKASKHINNAANIDISINVQTATSEQIEKSPAALIVSSEEEQTCMADNDKCLVDVSVDIERKAYTLQYKSMVSDGNISHFLDAGSQNDIERGQKVSRKVFEGTDFPDQRKPVYDMDTGGYSEQQWNKSTFAVNMDSFVVNSDDDMKDVFLTGNDNIAMSHLPTVDSCTPPDNTNNSGVVACIEHDGVMKHGEDAIRSTKNQHSDTLSHCCMFCESSDYLGLDGICLSCQGGNQPNADVCHDTSIQQSDLLEQTKISYKEAFKSVSFDSQELVSAACIVHILREVTFHVGLPAIRLPHLVEVAICTCFIVLQENPGELNISHLCTSNLVQG